MSIDIHRAAMKWCESKIHRSKTKYDAIPFGLAYQMELNTIMVISKIKWVTAILNSTKAPRWKRLDCTIPSGTARAPWDGEVYYSNNRATPPWIRSSGWQGRHVLVCQLMYKLQTFWKENYIHLSIYDERLCHTIRACSPNGAEYNHVNPLDEES